MPDPPIRRAFADLREGQVHYAECGPRDAPAVLLLHQTPRSWAEYAAVLPLLGRQWRAIAMDTVGFGDSYRPPWPASIERWATVAVELLDALGVVRAHLVGHHTGGVIAVELAAMHAARVGRVVLSSTPYVDAALRRERADRAPIDEVQPRPDGSHLAQLWQRRQSFYPAQRPDLLLAFVRDALRVIDRVEDGHRAVAEYRMEERIGRVRQPVLVIRAGADPFAAPHAATLCARLPRARLLDIAEGMVPLPDQLPEAFAAAVAGFLAEAA
jgi:pimeloyl-ACP methyl ester carboxylesterase